MSRDDLKELLKEAMIDLAAEGHHTCLIFKTSEDQQLARDALKIGKMTKMGFMFALVMFILGGAAYAIIGKLTGLLK